MSKIALTRPVSQSLPDCELTHLPRADIDVALARTQHAGYENALREAGCEVCPLPELPEQADAVFVEDTAVVLDEVAVLTRPGAASRRAESASMAEALSPWRGVRTMSEPATLDGGDVLRIGKTLYVGASGRSNREGMQQLAQFVVPFGYQVRAVPLRDCLHLKTAATQVAEDRVLLNPAWVDVTAFAGVDAIAVDPEEPFAGNAVWLGDRVLYSASHPATAQRLRDAGIEVVAVDMSETEKAEGAVTCCSVLLNA